MERLTGGLKRSDMQGMTLWGICVLLTWLLYHLAGEPGAKPANDLAMIAIVIGMAAIIQNRK